MAKQSKSTDSTSTKKPLVNWFSREKSKTKENTDSTFGYKKTVKAPESVLSRGFKKEKNYKAQYGDVNDSTSYLKYESLRSKEKMPNAKGGGGKKISYSKSSSVYGNPTADSSFSKTYEERTRKPSKGMSGVSKIKYNVSKNDSTIANYDKKTVTPKLSNSSKTPTVNWSNRTKEITKTPTFDKRGKDTGVLTTTRKVTTPKSKLSSGFEKNKTKKTEQRSATTLGLSALSTPVIGSVLDVANVGKTNYKTAAIPIAGAALATEMIRSRIPRTIGKTKTKKRTK